MKRMIMAATLAIFSMKGFALEVIRPVYKEKIVLKIVRAIPDGFETYALTNHNGREMTLVCAKNRFYENNPKAMIEYRNFYNERAGNFTIESDKICKEMGSFIEQAHHGIDETRPFLVTLSTKSMTVEKIVYPRIDPMSDSGDEKDLYPKKEIRSFPRPDMFYNY